MLDRPTTNQNDLELQKLPPHACKGVILNQACHLFRKWRVRSSSTSHLRPQRRFRWAEDFTVKMKVWKESVGARGPSKKGTDPQGRSQQGTLPPAFCRKIKSRSTNQNTSFPLANHVSVVILKVQLKKGPRGMEANAYRSHPEERVWTGAPCARWLLKPRAGKQWNTMWS